MSRVGADGIFSGQVGRILCDASTPGGILAQSL